jgi:uncharacterized protein (DUF433 family)
VTASRGGTVGWREHIICDPAILCGKPTLKGTRLSVEFVLDLLASGWTREEISENYPNLSEERVRAALAFAADTVRQRGKPGVLPLLTDNDSDIAEFRLAKGTRLNDLPNLDYMLQLMACLEAMHSAHRWGIYLDCADVQAVTEKNDRIVVWFVWAGWCAEAFRLLKQGERSGTLTCSMLGTKSDQVALWNRIIARNTDEIISKVHRIRDKYFGHFDPEVMKKFVLWQDSHGAPDPFFVGESQGKPLDCRFTWPIAACLLDLHGEPTNEGFAERVDKLLHSLEGILVQTGDLLQTLIETWLEASCLNSDSAWEIVETKRE